jgi:hypothetical protein
MSRYYGVLTAGRGDRVERTSRTGEEFLRADLCDETHTYRLEICEGGIFLARIGKRWQAADATPEPEWEVLLEKEGE